jgi:RNA polymerase sigma factor (sigma-70 family)
MIGTCDAPTRALPTEDLKRVPVTQEFLAVSIARESNGEKVSHPAKKFFVDALFDSIHDMVYKLAAKYKVTCHEEVDDLAQDCFCRIVEGISSFNPETAKFTTWSWWVCKSVLNRKYRKNTRRIQLSQRPYEGFDAADVSHNNTVFSIDFVEALRDLRVAYPNKVGLIHEIFGDPDKSGFVPGVAAGMTVAAEKAGMKYASAYYFYSKVAKPFLRCKLEGYSSVEGEEDE